MKGDPGLAPTRSLGEGRGDKSGPRAPQEPPRAAQEQPKEPQESPKSGKSDPRGPQDTRKEREKITRAVQAQQAAEKRTKR